MENFFFIYNHYLNCPWYSVPKPRAEKVSNSVKIVNYDLLRLCTAELVCEGNTIETLYGNRMMMAQTSGLTWVVSACTIIIIILFVYGLNDKDDIQNGQIKI